MRIEDILRNTAVLCLLAGTAAVHAQAVDAAAAHELAKASGCTSCHAANEKIVGPAFKDIAARYKDEKDAAASLAQSIQNGSKGKWGRVPMPAHASLASSDVKTLAAWVLQTPQ